MQSPVQLQMQGWLEAPYFQVMQQVTDAINSQDARTLLLTPEALDHFSCSGCAECCQRPWWIAVSKDYLEKWQPILEAHPTGEYKNAFTPKAAADLHYYAEINRKPGTNECVFLMDDRRCFMHATYGEEALNDTCRNFPRYESWIGSYLGKFAQTSCPDIAELIHTYPRFRYQVVQVQPDVWAKSFDKMHPLGFKEGFLWLGILLDLFHLAPWSPTGKLYYLTELLQTIQHTGLKQTNATTLGHMHHLMQTSFLSDPYPDAAAIVSQKEPALDWLIHFSQIFPNFQKYLKEIKSGWKSEPTLAETERTLFDHFCSAYLIYHCVTITYHKQDKSAYFFQPFFLLCLNLSLIQWLAIYYRDRAQEPLSLHHLVRASNLVGYRFEHNRNFVDKSGIANMPPEAAIHGITTLLSLEIKS